MTIAKRTPIFQCLLLAGALSLAACGGGGDGKKQPPADTTPNAISLAASTNVEPNTLVTSAPVTISGINTTSPVSIVGGEYSISGGAFTANPGTITNGQTLTVRITASDKTNTPKEAVVTVGGVSAKFAVTTAADVTPEAFTFAPKNDAQLNAEYTSDAITVGGIDVAVAVSVTGGLYSINGGAFTAAAGTVSPGQTITVKTTAAAKTETAQEAVLTIGGVSGTFSVTTIQDTMPPVAEFKFPTPYTMSEANQVKVRGTATDDNAITSVMVIVNGISEIEVIPNAETNGVKDFSSWTATVPLTANMENEIKVVAMDDRNNLVAIDAANKVVVRQRIDYSGTFPDSGSAVQSTYGLLLDQAKNRLFYTSSENADKVFSIDILTGETSIFADFGEQELRDFGMGAIDQSSQNAFFPIIGSSAKTILRINLSNPQDYSAYTNDAYLGSHRALTLDDTGDVSRLISVKRGDSLNSGAIVSTRMDTWEPTVLSDASRGIPDSTIPIDRTNSVVFDRKNNRYLVADSENDAVISVSPANGARRVFSSELVGSGAAYGVGEAGLIRNIALDEPRNRLIVLELFTGGVFAVNLDTAERVVVSQMTLLHPFPQNTFDSEKNYIGAQIDVEKELLYTVHHRVRALMVVDLQTGQQLILSKSAN